MNKKYLKKFQIKDKVAKNELIRAHGIIILLVAALMFVLTFVTGAKDLEIDPLLSFLTVFMLAVVGVLSLSVILALIRKK